MKDNTITIYIACPVCENRVVAGYFAGREFDVETVEYLDIECPECGSEIVARVDTREL